jgi:hypothetical protein
MSLALAVLTPSAALSQTKRSHSNEDLNVIGHRTLVKGPNFYSLDKERELGRLLAHEVERSSKLIADCVVTEYLNRLGENLAKNSDAKFPITIRLMDSNEINAFTLPGGLAISLQGGIWPWSVFMKRLLPAGPPSKADSKAVSPLPAPVEGAKAIREDIARLLPPRTGETFSSPDFEAVKERLRTWQPKDSPAPGAPPEKPALRKPAQPPNL